MNKEILLLLSLFVIISFRSYSQKDSVRVYQETINKAELAICDSDFRASLNFYQQAFAQKVPFSSDLNQAFTLSYILKDSSLAKKYAKELTKRVFPIKRKWIVQDSIKEPSFYNFIFKDLGQSANKVVYISKPYDFIINIMKEGAKMYQDQSLPEGIKLLTDSVMVMEIMDYIENNGFPQAKAYPTGYISQTTSTFFLIELNASLIVTNYKRADSLLLKEVKRGNLSPHDWEALIVFHPQITEDVNAALWSEYSAKLTESEKDIINQKRYQCLLEPLADYQRKYDFAKKMEALYPSFEETPILILPMELTPQDGTPTPIR